MVVVRNSYCSSYKTTADYPSDLDYVGRLHSLVYLTEEQMTHADLGPAGYVNSTMTTPQFTECAVQNTFQYFSQRSLDENDQDWLSEVALEMTHRNYSYKSMIRALVQTQAYRESQ